MCGLIRCYEQRHCTGIICLLVGTTICTQHPSYWEVYEMNWISIVDTVCLLVPMRRYNWALWFLHFSWPEIHSFNPWIQIDAPYNAQYPFILLYLEATGTGCRNEEGVFVLAMLWHFSHVHLRAEDSPSTTSCSQIQTCLLVFWTKRNFIQINTNNV